MFCFFRCDPRGCLKGQSLQKGRLSHHNQLVDNILIFLPWLGLQHLLKMRFICFPVHYFYLGFEDMTLPFFLDIIPNPFKFILSIWLHNKSHREQTWYCCLRYSKRKQRILVVMTLQDLWLPFYGFLNTSIIGLKLDRVLN